MIDRVQRESGADNLRLLFDIYHLATNGDDVDRVLDAYTDRIGHVQIADSPGRGEPGTGEIHYPFVLAKLERLGYDGYVGLEYNPTTETTEQSLAWLPRALRAGNVYVEDLKL